MSIFPRFFVDFGLVLGGFGEGLAVIGPSEKGPKRVQFIFLLKSCFSMDLGRVLGGFGEGFGRVLGGFGRFWEPLGRFRDLSALFWALLVIFAACWCFC